MHDAFRNVSNENKHVISKMCIHIWFYYYFTRLLDPSEQLEFHLRAGLFVHMLFNFHVFWSFLKFAQAYWSFWPAQYKWPPLRGTPSSLRGRASSWSPSRPFVRGIPFLHFLYWKKGTQIVSTWQICDKYFRRIFWKLFEWLKKNIY